MNQVTTVPESCELNAAFISRMKTPIMHVWNAIAADLVDALDDVVDNYCAVEFCVDANHLSSIAEDKEADELLHKQVKIHGYVRTIKYLSKNIHLV